MMRKKVSIRKPGGASGIAVVDDPVETNQAPEAAGNETPNVETVPSKPKRKANVDQESSGNIGISDVRKAAVFANSVGGLDRAIALLQILKVAKEVQ